MTRSRIYLTERNAGVTGVEEEDKRPRGQHEQWMTSKEAEVTENGKHRKGKTAVNQGTELSADEEERPRDWGRREGCAPQKHWGVASSK